MTRFETKGMLIVLLFMLLQKLLPFYSASPKYKDLLNRILIQGAEYLEKALELGKGVIAVSAHLGF